MTLWVTLIVTVIILGAWIVRPLLERNRIELDESEHALSIFRDQLDELDRDVEMGFISPAQRAQAEQEIERRAARAARERSAGIALARRSPVGAAIAGAAIAGGSFGLYLLLGSPELPDQPLAARQAQMERTLAEAHAGVEIERGAPAKDQDDSFERWWTEARRFAGEGDYASAADAYRRAAALSGDAPAVVSAYAEALTLANGNKVPAAARIVFQQVLTKAPKEPRARYYLALAEAQAKNFDAALEAWLALLADSAPDAPWVALVRRDIVNMARFTRRDLASVLPDASEEELARAKASPEQVASAQPASDPSSRVDWRRAIETAQARAAQGDREAARSLLESARRDYVDAPFVAAQIDQALAAIESDARRRGPSDADVAAASALSEDERDQMVRAMVDGLAERLRNDPSDVEGWLMLIRSYAVLQERDLAEQAARDALAAFDAGPKRSRLLRSAAELGLAIN